MLIVLSPAKTLDYETPLPKRAHTVPEFLPDSGELIGTLRDFSADRLAGLMDISGPLASLNVERFANWTTPFNLDNARQAALAFAGDVYEGLQAQALSAQQLQFAQKRVRILSGLYGLLKPLDLMQPYRLEMGTRLANHRGKDLYAFWGDKLAVRINAELAASRYPVLVNLASDEYFRAVPMRALAHPVVQPVFQERKGAAWKVISFHAKRARGLMTRFAIDNRIDDPKHLKEFDREGYRFVPDASDAASWVFRREHPAGSDN